MAKTLLQPLAIGFRLGVSLRLAAYRRGWLKTRRLGRPVVSVGNLALGGTGKTPLVEYLARSLARRGFRPAILTRGYGRRKGAALLPIPPAQRRNPHAAETGDEPALLARHLPEIPVVICADRYRAGRLAEEQFSADIHIVDDGFQHFALARDVDVVLLDATRELSDRSVFPAGRLREPCAALARAHIVVVTRAELADPQPLEERVRAINPALGIFRGCTKFAGLADARYGTPWNAELLRGKPVYAFCGVGNPGAFFAGLRQWGFSVAGEESFRDHHVYASEEIAGLVERARTAGATALLTTEKDAVNFPQAWRSDLGILACLIRAEISNPEEFERAIVNGIGPRRASG